jgi:hypothetical protein
VSEAKEGGVDAVAEDVEDVFDAGLSVGGQSPELGASDHDDLGELARAVAQTRSWPDEWTRALDDVVLQALLRPGKIVGVGLNYVEHVQESSRTLDTDQERPTRPACSANPLPLLTGPPNRSSTTAGSPPSSTGNVNSRLSLERQPRLCPSRPHGITFSATASSTTSALAINSAIGTLTNSVKAV